MSWRSLVLTCLLCLCTSAAFAQRALPLAQDELLHSARVWEAKDRGDMARLALEKLVAARPDSPEPLFELGELHLRMSAIDEARTILSQLESRFPGSRAAKTLATAYRVATRDRLQLASVQRLLQLGRGAEAKAALLQLFPEGPPDGMYGIEYFRMLARTPGGRDQARAGLSDLLQRHPGDAKYLFALARHLSGEEATALEGIEMFHALAQRDDVKLREVDIELGSAIRDLGYRRAPAHIVRAYSARHPEDAEAAQLLARRSQFDSEERLLTSTAKAASDPTAQRRNLQKMMNALLKRFDASSQFATAISALRGLRGADDAPHRFDAATAEAIAWGQASIQSAATDLARAELEADIAVAFASERFEATVDLASRLESLGDRTTANRLRATAAHLEPTSNWLFETHIRALLDEQDTAGAIALLEQRPLTAQWTTRDRDALIARALDIRSARSISTGDRAQARSELTRAVALAPNDPWLRYRLASLYVEDGQPSDATALLREGLARSPNDPDMRFAAALHLSSLDQHEEALALLEPIPIAQRSAGMVELHERLRIARARALANERQQRGDTNGAHEALSAVQALADRDLERASELANAWFDLGDVERALAQFEAHRHRSGADKQVQLAWANALNRAEDARLDEALEALRRRSDLSSTESVELARLERSAALRTIRALQWAERYDEAADNLDALLATTPDDLELGIARAELDLVSGRAIAARDRYAALIAQTPDDLDLRMDYVRALTATRDFEFAQLQLSTVIERAEFERRSELAREAGRTRMTLEARNDKWVEAGIEFRHKPGDSGISQFDALFIPTEWSYGRGFRHRFTLYADALSLDPGELTSEFDTAALLGSIQAAGPAATPRFRNEQQDGVAFDLEYSFDDITVDLGTTPLGFLLTNVIGGVEWSPQWKGIDFDVGIERRAVTSSVLSYAGMQDPITGRNWGGVIETGPYVQAGHYREHWSVAGSLRRSRLSGRNVPDNDFTGVRIAADCKIFATDGVEAFVGAAITHWNYEHNLQNYTFGHGGYYSPQSYTSISLPMEVQGAWRGFSYRLRISFAYSDSEIDPAQFYPTDAELQAAAASSPLPSGFDAPMHTNEGGHGTSVSGYAAIERQVLPSLVVGAKLDLDRADYYEPTVVMIYLRHIFGRTTPIEVPPRPVR